MSKIMAKYLDQPQPESEQINIVSNRPVVSIKNNIIIGSIYRACVQAKEFLDCKYLTIPSI